MEEKRNHVGDYLHSYIALIQVVFCGLYTVWVTLPLDFND